MSKYKDMNTEEQGNIIFGFFVLAVLGIFLIWIIYLIASWLYVSEDEKLYSDCLDEMSEPFQQANRNRKFMDHYIVPTEAMEWSCSQRLENGELALESKKRLEAIIAEYQTSQDQTKTPKLQNDVSETVKNTAPEKTIACGGKEITIKDGKMTKMVHEDGTIHTRYLNTNWNYDGESITHNAVKERILCSETLLSREEKINISANELLDTWGRGYSEKEAIQVRDYAVELMRSSDQCNLVINAAKSENKQNMFYIDCSKKNGGNNRIWVSSKELSPD